MNNDWKLTDQEIEAGASQTDKRKAYIEAGGVILNPDALEDMYKTLKEAERVLSQVAEIVVEIAKSCSSKHAELLVEAQSYLSYTRATGNLALAKAEVK